LLFHVGEFVERSGEGGVSPVETLQRLCNSIGGDGGFLVNIGFEVAEVSLCSALEGFMASIQVCLQSGLSVIEGGIDRIRLRET
jgi:hypothetical protein